MSDDEMVTGLRLVVLARDQEGL